MTNMITITQLFLAVCQIENPKQIKGEHPDSVSYGLAGVTANCLADVNRNYGSVYSLDDMDQHEAALDVFEKYTDLRLKVRHMEPTPENRLRVWHGASDEDEQKRYVDAVWRKYDESH